MSQPRMHAAVRGAAAAGIAAALLATTTINVAAQATEVTFWSWVPGISDQVDAFNASQSAIHVNYVGDKGNGNAEYANLNTALAANAGVPDVVQIEFQHLPSYIATNALVDLTKYGANDVKAQFVPWTISQVSQGDGIYAYPQDAGPMIVMCNKDLLDAAGVTAPTTWDEFKTTAATFHQKDPSKYLANFTPDQGHFFGLLWQSGAKPFTIDGTNIKIDFSSPEVTRVAQLWDDLRASGDLAPVDTYSTEWTAAIGNGSIACWSAGAWGPEVIEPAAKGQDGKWQAYQMPQWSTGAAVNGNYGGSTIAVTAASQNPQAAETFARWLNTDPAATLALANGKAGLFPVTTTTLADPAWADFAAPFWGGQKLHQVTAEAAKAVDVNFQWSPFTDFVYRTFADDVAAKSTLVATMTDLQAKSTQYATDQGYTVTP